MDDKPQGGRQANAVAAVLAGFQQLYGLLACSALPIKLLLVFVHDKQALLLPLLVDVVIGVFLDVGVNDGDQLASRSCQVLLHGNRVWEEMLVPGEVPATKFVKNVQKKKMLKTLSTQSECEHCRSRNKMAATDIV